MEMAVILMAQRVINGKNKFEDVPNSLKVKVYEDLVDSGAEHLANGWKPEITEEA